MAIIVVIIWNHIIIIITPIIIACSYTPSSGLLLPREAEVAETVVDVRWCREHNKDKG